jgi:hypothetical protein
MLPTVFIEISEVKSLLISQAQILTTTTKHKVTLLQLAAVKSNSLRNFFLSILGNTVNNAVRHLTHDQLPASRRRRRNSTSCVICVR